MSTRTTALIPEFAEGLSRSTINLLVLYDDVTAGRRAVELCRRLAVQLGRELQVEIKPWKFGLFDMPRVREVIDAEVQGADFILVSMSEPGRLPAAVKLCLDRWAGQTAGRPVALVGVFHESVPAHGLNAALEQLHDTAERAGADFFHNHDWAVAGLTAAARSIAQRAGAMTLELDDVFSLDFAPPLSHWGINE